MEGQRPTDRAREYYDIAIQVITGAKHKNVSTDDLIAQIAWGQRSCLMGDQELATAVRATYILLEKVNQKLDKLEQSLRR